MCEIANIWIDGTGMADGFPLAVVANVDCTSVNVELRWDPADDRPFAGPTNVVANLNGNGKPVSIDAEFTVPDGKHIPAWPRCGESVYVTITCADDPTCTSGPQLVAVHCKGYSACPSYSDLSPSTSYNRDLPCLDEGHYTVTAGRPYSSGAFSWTREPSTLGQPLPDDPHAPWQATFLVAAGDPQSIVRLTWTSSECPTISCSVVVPRAHTGQGGSGFTVQVTQGGQTIAGPHRNTDSGGAFWTVANPVAAGTYTIDVIDPPGALCQWTDGTGSPIASASGASCPLTVASGQSATLGFAITTPQSCAATLGSVTLTGTPEDGGSSSSSSSSSSTPPPPGPPVPPISWCDVLHVLAGLALVVAFAAIILAFCSVLSGAAPASLLAIVATALSAILAAVLPQLTIVIAVALAAAAVSFLLIYACCTLTLCVFLRILAWALEWTVVAALVILVLCLLMGGGINYSLVLIAPAVALVIVIWALVDRHCQVPTLLNVP